MPRDGAGTYTRTHADYVYGEVIDQVAVNAELNDIATALTGSLTGKFWWGGTAGGTADARTIAPSPSISTYAAGQEWAFINGAAANATATPTLAISGLAPRTGKRADGSALVPGDWPANALIRVIDDGTNLRLAERVGGSFAGSIIQAEGAAVASAATTDIWANDGDTVHITGTTTITSFGTAVQAGQWKKVIFDGVLTLTHGANLSLPGSANITTAADDMAFVYADTATQFDVLYFKKNGEATRSFSRSTVASAATTANIWDAGGQIDWTGTVTCTDFPAAPQAGAERILICAGAASFTAGATMAIAGYAAGKTLTCAQNDIILVRALTTTTFHLTHYRYLLPPQTINQGSLAAGGTADAMTLTTVDGQAPANGNIYMFRTPGTNTVSNPTLNINGAGATVMKKNGGAALVTNQWTSGAIIQVMWYGGEPNVIVI